MEKTVLRKVCDVINSCDNYEQLLISEKYIELYYKHYGKEQKWIVESHYNNKLKSFN